MSHQTFVTPMTREQLEVLRGECLMRAANGRGREFYLEAARKVAARIARIDAASTTDDAKGER